MLIIEIDGDPHCTEQGREHDRVRDSYLTKLGYKILRVPGYEVIREDGIAAKQINLFVETAPNANTQP